MRFGSVRQAFGKRLIDQPVIRLKFADCFARVEAAQALLENITYQVNAARLPRKQSQRRADVQHDLQRAVGPAGRADRLAEGSSDEQ
jgi:alkylation response protein AidB-like acyl-CoA dehydrogenase